MKMTELLAHRFSKPCYQTEPLKPSQHGFLANTRAIKTLNWLYTTDSFTPMFIGLHENIRSMFYVPCFVLQSL